MTDFFNPMRSRALFTLLLLSLVLGACTPSGQVARQARPTCAQSAVHAYRGGDFACAERLLPFVKNEASRHELLAYMFIKTGRVERGVMHLGTAIDLLESAPGYFQNGHARQAKRLRAVRDRFSEALSAFAPAQTAGSSPAADTTAAVAVPPDTSTTRNETDDRDW
jgi:hypothetical protein